MAQKKRDFTKHVTFILPDASGNASDNTNSGQTIDQLDTYLEAQRVRQRHMQDLALELRIDQSYTGPLHRVRVLFKQSGQDNRHLAATQDHLEIKCSFASGDVACEVYFDPASDDVLLFNSGQSLVQVREQAEDTAGAEGLPPEELKLLSPGPWLSVEEIAGPSIAKRAGENSLPPSKRLQASSGAMIAPTVAQPHGDSATSTEPSAPPESRTTITKSLHPHELAQTEAGQRIVIKNTDTQETEYTLERLGNWVYSRTHTHMFTAVLRNGESSPTVAVLMPKLWEKPWRDLPKRELYAAVHTANSWWRRYDMMVNLKHVRLSASFYGQVVS